MTAADASSGPATRYEVSGGVVTITLSRPDSRNALTNELLNSLGDNLEAAAEDEAVRVIVLTNEGPAFCAGADLKGGAPTEPLRRPLPAVLAQMLDHPKPVVGRIAGHCMGGGVGLAAACDLAVVADDVLLGFTEVRIGVAPAIISVVCLPKLRRGDALALFLTGERIQADRAVEVGLVSRAVTRDGLDAAVEEVVSALLQGSPAALAAAKSLVRRVPGMDRGEAFEWTARLSAELFAGEEAREGMAAFRERRAPRWVPEGGTQP